MNFEEAIAAHSAWKMKLKQYIAKPDRSLAATEVGADDKCALGQWIRGEGQKHSALPEFSKLRSDHARFHKLAADIIKRADAGEKVAEEVALGSRSDFASVSSAVVTDLMNLQKKVQLVHAH